MLEGTCYATVTPNETTVERIEPTEPEGVAQAPRVAYASHELGRRGEEAAARYLVDQGWEILERNWRWEHGEVDIIAHNSATPDNCVTLIEVKTRYGKRGDPEIVPELAVNEEKQARYLASARRYLQLHQRFELVRFDAIGITAWDEGGGAHLHHTFHAIQADS